MASLDEQKRIAEDETRERAALLARFRNLEHEADGQSQHLDEELAAKENLTRLLSKPTDIEKYPLKPEVVWSWRYEQDGMKWRFNAHFDGGGNQAQRFSRTVDPQSQPGV